MYQQPKFLLGGDKALYIELGDGISPEVNRRVMDLLNALDRAAIPGITGLSPTYRSILVYYDPLKITLEELKKRTAALSREASEGIIRKARVVEVPTLYGGEFGPDLEFVASHNGLSPEKVIEIHSSANYLVYMLGFNPGFPYLGGMSEKIATPRLSTPRVKIPAGSVGIAESQTGVYPLEGPGGWRLIGRTPIHIFDPHEDPPVIIKAGDYIRFVPIDEGSYEEIRVMVEAGSYSVTIRAGD